MNEPLFYFLLFIAIALGIHLLISRQSIARTLSRLNAAIEALESDNARLKTENQALAQFREILDATAESERILADARRAAEELRNDASLIHDKASNEAKNTLEKSAVEAEAQRVQASQSLKEARERVESIMRSAQQEAGNIIDSATKRGEEIAGSAFEAVKNAERYESVAKAMKNLIEGYGDQYVVPSRSLLDELAEDYGFTEARV